MSTPTVSWDETTPSGSENISLGDNRIQELKTQLREVISVDHEFANSGQTATTGQHKQVTLQEQANLGTGAVGATILGNQTVSGKGELVYVDEDNNDVQITSGGKTRAESLGGVYPVANLAAIATLLDKIYFVGIVITSGVSTNPNTLLGIGTWAQIKGKVIVGIADSGTFNTLDATGGVETVTLTSAQSGLPAHTHTSPLASPNTGGTSGVPQNTPGPADTTSNASNANSAADAAQAHTNLQPYQVKYVWQRTA